MSPQPAINQTTCEPAVQELDEAQLDALMLRIREAKEHNLALSAEDYDVLMNAMLMLASMQERLNNNDLTVAKLKKLLGMVKSSEKLKDLRPPGHRLIRGCSQTQQPQEQPQPQGNTQERQRRCGEAHGSSSPAGGPSQRRGMSCLQPG